MRLFLVVALVCFVIALIAFGVPTLVLGLSGSFWTAAGLLAWLLDSFSGSVHLGPRQP